MQQIQSFWQAQGVMRQYTLGKLLETPEQRVPYMIG